MSLATQKLYYRRNDTTYSCNLYTTTSDFSDASSYTGIVSEGTTFYIPVGSTSDARASHLRIYDDNTTKAIWNSAVKEVASFTNFGSINDNGYSITYNSYSVTVDYNSVWRSGGGSFYNIKIVYTVINTSGYTINPYCMIDSVTQYYGSNVGSGTYTKYYRLSTGTHTIRLYGHYEEIGESSSKTFDTVGDRIVP